MKKPLAAESIIKKMLAYQENCIYAHGGVDSVQVKRGRLRAKGETIAMSTPRRNTSLRFPEEEDKI